MPPLGLYLSIPFCKAKCTFCNFASDVFAASRMDAYMDRLHAEIAGARLNAESLGALLPQEVDSIFLGGGTPTLLPPRLIASLFDAIRRHFEVDPAAEITVECAPGQLEADTLAALVEAGVNRISLGVQSFVDWESAAVGRLHTAWQCTDEIARIRAAGIDNINLDLICGLPYQTSETWRQSLQSALETEVPHLSVYMLEIDEDSRLGRELLAQGHRYSAAATPSDDETADLYLLACNLLDQARVRQYEISNFARPGAQSLHNRKYWQRDPYLGVGLDAHSMLLTRESAVRFANTGDLEQYLQEQIPSSRGNAVSTLNPFALAPLPSIRPDFLTLEAAFEESFFLGLRLVEGIELESLRQRFGPALVAAAEASLEDLLAAGLVLHPRGESNRVALTARGRLLSNEVFSRLLVPAPV